LSGIKYHYMNENAPERIEMYGGDSRKISCDVHFDDKCAYGFMGWRKADCYVQYLAHRKPVIICIVGESGSGKTFLAEYIERNFSVKAIQSWTTRPRRTPCESGHEFITNEEFNKFKRSEMIAHTKFGEHRYCCLKSDVLEENTYVLDEFGLSHLRDNYSDDYDIYSIRVRCNKKERIERAGQERVDRDEDKFKMPSILFDHLWFTDSWRCESLNRSRDYDKLHNFVNRCLNRGWQ